MELTQHNCQFSWPAFVVPRVWRHDTLTWNWCLFFIFCWLLVPLSALRVVKNPPLHPHYSFACLLLYYYDSYSRLFIQSVLISSLSVFCSLLQWSAQLILSRGALNCSLAKTPAASFHSVSSHLNVTVANELTCADGLVFFPGLFLPFACFLPLFKKRLFNTLMPQINPICCGLSEPYFSEAQMRWKSFCGLFCLESCFVPCIQNMDDCVSVYACLLIMSMIDFSPARLRLHLFFLFFF